MHGELIHDHLDNGIELAIKENRFSKAVAIQCWVGVGSAFEQESERGLAHFLEHMLFKGTTRRAVGEISAEVEACGGSINAYTSFDRTVFYLSLPSKNLEVGVDLLADALYNSSFDEVEFNREKEVILEEIRRSNDSPGVLVGREVFSHVYAGTEMARPITGFEDQVAGFCRDDLIAFYQKWYQPENMAVVMVGDFHPGEAFGLVTQKFAGGSFGEKRRRQVPNKSPGTPQPKPGVQVRIVRGDYRQPRIEFGFTAPDHQHPHTPALDLAAFALGSSELSRFNQTLRDQEGVITGAAASHYAPTFSGVFEVSALPVEGKLLPAISGLAREVERLRALAPVTTDEMDRARAGLVAEREFRDETVDGQAKNLGIGLTTSQKLVFDDMYSAAVDNLPAASVQMAVKKWLDPKNVVIAVLVDEQTVVTEEQIRQAFLTGIEAAQGASPKTAPQVKTNATRELEVIVQDIKPGVRLIYRHNPDAKLFSLTTATEGGLQGEDEASNGLFNAVAGLLGLASVSSPFAQTMKKIEGLGAYIAGYSGKDSIGLQLQCLSQHVDEILTMFGDMLLTPVFPEEQWGSLQRETLQSIATQNDSPAHMCLRAFQQAVYQNHPYARFLLGEKETVSAFTTHYLQEKFRTFRDAGPWVFAAAGPLNPDVMLGLWERTVKDFKPDASGRRFDVPESATAAKQRVSINKDREQVHIAFGYSGLPWHDPDRYALDVLINILGGLGGRLFITLRDRDSLAYTVSPIVTYGQHPGLIGSYIACAPAKIDQALAGLQEQMHALKDTLVTDTELRRARNYIVGHHEMGLQRSDAQTMTMALMELYGLGYDDFLTYPRRIAEVTRGCVRRVAERLFQGPAVEVIVGPKT